MRAKMKKYNPRQSALGKEKNVFPDMRILLAIGGTTLLALLLPIFLYAPLMQVYRKTHAAGNSFVTRSGATLSLNGLPFRFAGSNIYWLGLSEKNGTSYPTTYAVDDGLDTA